MKTREQIEEWLNTHLPDGPEGAYQDGVQDALNWVLGHIDDLDVT